MKDDSYSMSHLPQQSDDNDNSSQHNWQCFVSVVRCTLRSAICCLHLPCPNSVWGRLRGSFAELRTLAWHDFKVFKIHENENDKMAKIDLKMKSMGKNLKNLLQIFWIMGQSRRWMECDYVSMWGWWWSATAGTRRASRDQAQFLRRPPRCCSRSRSCGVSSTRYWSRQQSHRSIVIHSNTTGLTTSVVKLKTKVCKVFAITEKDIPILHLLSRG